MELSRLPDVHLAATTVEVPMLRTRISLLSLLALAFVTACETIEGAGEDIENTGESISETAQEADS